MNIAHIESMGFGHQAHSFVRGNWRNAKELSPLILQKCCHDMDIILWLVGSTCKKISSFGKLTYFTAEQSRLVGQTIDFEKYKEESYGVIMTNTEENNEYE